MMMIIVLCHFCHSGTRTVVHNVNKYAGEGKFSPPISTYNVLDEVGSCRHAFSKPWHQTWKHQNWPIM